MERSIDETMEKLFPRRKNFVKNRLLVNNINNMNSLGPFVHCSYKRSQLINVVFTDSDMHNSAWTDSSFNKVKLINCNLNSANFQMSSFDECLVKNNRICNASFNHGYYKNVKFENIEFNNCVFSDTIFMNCQFINCKLKSSSFDGAKFILCTFDRLIARNLNMDFSQYRACDFHNSEISLFQCAYTIGIIQALNSRDNENVFGFQGTNLSTDRFFDEYIDYLIVYFKEQNEYFPLANIELYKKNISYGKALIGKGIRDAVKNHKYRVALHYCELINYYNCFSSIEKREIINDIGLFIASVQGEENVSEAIRYSVLLEHVLLNSYDNRQVYYISLQTDLIEQSKNNNEITSFIANLDKLLTTYQGNEGEHNITITHNSPLWVDIVLAIAGGIAGNYLKDGLDCIIKKIKTYVRKRKTKLTSLTVKVIDSVDAIIENNKQDNNGN